MPARIRRLMERAFAGCPQIEAGDVRNTALSLWRTAFGGGCSRLRSRDGVDVDLPLLQLINRLAEQPDLFGRSIGWRLSGNQTVAAGKNVGLDFTNCSKQV